MRIQAYWDLRTKHEQEIKDFPIAWAFNEKQLKEALEKIGAKDISECCTVIQCGDIVKKTDAKDFLKMLERHVDEIHDLLKSDKDLAKDIFLFEMDNHEYAINMSGDEDVLASLSLTEKQLKEFDLGVPYALARREHMKNAEDWI